MKKITLFSVFTLVALMLTSGLEAKNPVKLAAAGATFPQPFYNTAFKAYYKSNKVQVDYGGIGSGGGIRSLKDEVVDFGASDAYLSDEELKAMPSEVLHIPTCMGAVVLSYNLPGVKSLKLTGSLVSDIFMGKITKWNDPALVAENPGVNLPDQNITSVHRSDGSGTTFIFSDYLTKVSPEWKNEIGTGKSLNWKSGIAAKGNPGVAGTIKQTSGSIGYIGSEYAFAMKIPMASLKNSSGNYVDPNGASISASAETLPADNRIMVTNTPSAQGYPISCFTWILVYKEQFYKDRSKEKAEETVALIKWMLSKKAQAMTTTVNYAPLPQSAVDNSMVLLNSMTYKGSKL